MISVTFFYDEATAKWASIVMGASDATEARQAFAAVVLTCQMLDPESIAVHIDPERN